MEAHPHAGITGLLTSPRCMETDKTAKKCAAGSSTGDAALLKSISITASDLEHAGHEAPAADGVEVAAEGARQLL